MAEAVFIDFLKNFKKPVDKSTIVCYTVLVMLISQQLNFVLKG